MRRGLSKSSGEFQGEGGFGIKGRGALKDIVHHKGVARDAGEMGGREFKAGVPHSVRLCRGQQEEDARL